ncbi:MAG: type I-E CRISPR-associated endoribonuclease Cas2e [Solirubrobacteraceae bacterium]
MSLTVIVVERVSSGLRGDLTRWLLQPQAGVFTGDVTPMVRERLWRRVCTYRGAGACLLIAAARNEQGLEIRQHGDRSRELIDLDGFALIRLPLRENDRA